MDLREHESEMGSINLGYGSRAGYFDCGNGLQDFIKAGSILNSLATVGFITVLFIESSI
jgi:hypothetical protein